MHALDGIRALAPVDLREIAQRAFSDWRMAYLSPDVLEMSRWAGLEGTGTIEELLEHVHRDAQRVPRILVSIVKAIAAQAP